MAYGSYNQYDSRWGKKNYNGSSTMANAGCGPTSCANILHNIDPSITPITTMKYMQTHGDSKHKTFAIYGNGTAWNGIPACLKAFGAKEVKTQDVSKSMTNVWKVLKKGHVAVFLMSAGKRGGIVWTTGGHYIAIIGYKYENNKHYVKVEDCGGRAHDGWYCYETQMRGLIPKVWTCLAEENIKVLKKPTGNYTGTLPTKTLKNGSSGNDVKKWQKFIVWYAKITDSKFVDGKFGPNTEKYTKRFQKTEDLQPTGIVDKNTYLRANAYKPLPDPKPELAPEPTPTPTPEPVPATATAKTKAEKIVDAIDAIAWEYGTAQKKWDYDTGAPRDVCKKIMIEYGYTDKIQFSDCGYCADTALRLGIGLKVKTLPSSPSAKFEPINGLTKVHSGSKVPDNLLEPGDVVRYKKTNGAQHILIFYGWVTVDGVKIPVIAEGGRGCRFFVKRKDTKKYNATNVKHSTIEVWRAMPDVKKCIDVSYWQGKISQENWTKIKKTCEYAICRASYTSQSKFSLNPDSTFSTNFTNAQKAGLKVGAYHYSQAITVDEAKKEAEYLCNILKDYKPTFYVVCDFEYGGRLNSNIGKKASDIANAFCDVVKAHGYNPCIYANTSTLNNALTNPKYPVWVAQYNSTCTYKGNKVMWQYTSSGKVDGIVAANTNNGTTKVDLSYVYV